MKANERIAPTPEPRPPPARPRLVQQVRRSVYLGVR